MIGIINCDNGNVHAIKNMLFKIGYDADLVRDVQEFERYKILFLPGVGSFDQLIKGLNERKIYQYLKNFPSEKFLIGICVGMQILLNKSEEGECEGLSLINGNVKKIKLVNDLRLPHIGWNKVEFQQNIFDRKESKFYFCHSDYAEVDKKNILAIAKYSHDFPSAIINDKQNVFGFQFHPEKSHKFGLELFSKLLDHLNA